VSNNSFIATASSSPIVVAVPVKDEEERIARCLSALSSQRDIPPYQILLLLNNCTDETAAIVGEIARTVSIPVHAVEVSLPPELANAGHARHLAMEAAAELVALDGVLLTTDADGCVDPNWIALNLRGLRRGADAIAGRIEIDPAEAAMIPLRLHEDDTRECAYADLLDQIDAAINPELSDPLPRHTEHSGASIAVTLSTYRRVGGIPPLALGEDRAFFAALRRIDARIRHAPEVRVMVSGRTMGRAAGGMADTIRRRMIHPDETLDDRLEPALDALRRVELRRLTRAAWSAPSIRSRIGQVLAHQLVISASEVEHALSLPYAGAAWAALEPKTPSLIRKMVRVTELEHQTEQAQAILRRLRSRPPAFRSPSQLIQPTVHERIVPVNRASL
jgi:hypothetical protein